MSANVGAWSNAARNLAQIGRSKACWICVAGILGIHLLVDARSAVASVNGWYEMLGLSRDGFVAGKVWQLATHGLLHGSWMHAGLNALFVLLIGSRIEHMTGPSGFWRTLVAGVVGGGLGHLLLGSGLLVGLSGGCMALLLLLTTLSPQSRMLPIPVSARSLGLGVMIAEGILTLIHPALGIPGLAAIGQALTDAGLGSWFQFGHACHVGGGVAGWLVGRWLLRPRVSLASLRRERARREAR